MAYPNPYSYFKYTIRVQAPSNGTVQTIDAFNTPDASGPSVVYDNLGSDSPTQLGDVSGDTYTAYFPNNNGTSSVGHFIGATPDGQSFVGYNIYNSKKFYYLYTNKKYAAKKNVAYTAGKEYTICYVAGTLIRTTRGEIAVERLAIGDHVVTASGAHRPVKWLGHRAYSGRLARSNPDLLPICFKAGALADNVPVRDLWVSPKHAMFLDGVLIPAEHLVNGVSVVKAERIDGVEYWHVELDSHDVLLAEGAPSESFVNDHGRAIFHNAHTFHEMYPEDDAVEAVYCAPRVEDGYILDAVRRRLAVRAGLDVASLHRLGELRGMLDRCDGHVIQGWAQDMSYPDAPVCLDIVVDGIVVARTYAERFRPDLLEAGIGDGHHAFDMRLPVPLSRDVAHRVEIRRSADGCAVDGTKEFAASPPAFAAA